ncbi:hypothetical protein MPSEU_001053700 [Mayamaea pseudoterrestris]|nr:hypothetical protein MPSEU_001053700 [Mayamaea pseudoterrestris]
MRLLYILGLSLVPYGDSFTLPRNAQSRKTHALLAASSSPSSLSQHATDDAARAGEGGFSVLRQPASRKNWDPDADVSFDAPLLLTDEPPMQRDTEWWNARFGQQNEHKKSKRELDSENDNRPSPDILPDASSLDLYQRTLDTLDFPRILQALEEQCTTVPAKRIIQKQLHQRQPGRLVDNEKVELREAVPTLMADTVDGSRERYQAVRELQWLQIGSTPTTDLSRVSYRNHRNYKQSVLNFPYASSNSFDLELFFQATQQGRVLQGAEIRAVADMMESLQNTILWGETLQEHVGDEFIALPKMTQQIPFNETLYTLLTTALEPDTDTLSGKTFPLVAQLWSRVRSLRADILQTLDDLLSKPSMRRNLALDSGGALYSEMSSSGRLVIPVDSSAVKNNMGIVHDTSRSGKTVFVEPTQIVGPTNELRQAESELQREEARIWRLLTEQIILNQESLLAGVNRGVAQLDLARARLQVGEMIQGVIPSVEDEGVIVLENAKHPVLLLRRVDNVVGSDVDLGRGENQGLVLTGPNSGGKTVILKLLGLMALMARCGIPVPADGAKERDGEVVYIPRVDCFKPVLADIGDIQSVGGDLSTFSGHMLVCREVLAESQRNALVLMDEVGSGTDPNQGVALAQALLESLLETGARVAITTHFMQLKQLASSDNRFSVGGMQFVNGRPTYKLIPGVVGESFALSVAERLKLPQKVIDRANMLLDSETRQMGDLIRGLEDQKVLLDQQSLELEEKQKEVARLEQKLVEEKIRLEKKQLIARREEAKKFAKTLELKEQALEDLLRKLKEDPSRRVVAKSWDEIKVIKRDVMKEAENVPSVLARKQQNAAVLDNLQAELVPLADMDERPDFQPGDMLMVCKRGPLLGLDAEFVSASGKTINVKVNNMSMNLKMTDLSLPGQLPASMAGINQPKKIQMTAAERAIAMERKSKPKSASPPPNTRSSSSSGVTFRIESNTVDVRGLTFHEAQDKIRTKFSSVLMSRQTVVFVLHGHGTGGVLRNKIRSWLQSERQLVKTFESADAMDGGDAFTRVELR